MRKAKAGNVKQSECKKKECMRRIAKVTRAVERVKLNMSMILEWEDGELDELINKSREMVKEADSIYGVLADAYVAHVQRKHLGWFV